MFRVSIDKGQLQNVEKLAVFLEQSPAKIQRANDRAASMAQKRIKENLRKRGRPGRFVKVEYKKYGPFGLKFSFGTRGVNRGTYGGGGGQQGYSVLWASRIFLNAEQGITGRRAFVLPDKGIPASEPGKPKEFPGGRYILSHSSGRWKKGQQLGGPLKIPAIGPFHFSAKSGMPRQKIQKTAAAIIRDELNKSYKKEFGKIMRSS